MELLDPATGRPLPPDAIQRVLFVAAAVHVYDIPPLASMRGHSAAAWTADPARHIFTARLRVVETALSDPDSDASPSSAPGLKVDVILEDPASAQLFAAAPYTHRAVVEPAVDSARFFALTVRDHAARKAVLGLGFEDRSDAFDFAVALQEAARGLGWHAPRPGPRPARPAQPVPKDYSLKDGETIAVDLSAAAASPRSTQKTPPRPTARPTTPAPAPSLLRRPPSRPPPSPCRPPRAHTTSSASAAPCATWVSTTASLKSLHDAPRLAALSLSLVFLPGRYRGTWASACQHGRRRNRLIAAHGGQGTCSHHSVLHTVDDQWPTQT